VHVATGRRIERVLGVGELHRGTIVGYRAYDGAAPEAAEVELSREK
jgi:hypothetical protein